MKKAAKKVVKKVVKVKGKFKLGPIQRAWTRALRSGKYTQAQGTLAEVVEGKPIGFCCLGVLCEVAKKKGLRMKVKLGDKDISYDESHALLPDKVRRFAALREEDGKFGGADETLATLNDVEGYSFGQIADAIEEHAETLFRRSV